MKAEHRCVWILGRARAHDTNRSESWALLATTEKAAQITSQRRRFFARLELHPLHLILVLAHGAQLRRIHSLANPTGITAGKGAPPSS